MTLRERDLDLFPLGLYTMLDKGHPTGFLRSQFALLIASLSNA